MNTINCSPLTCFFSFSLIFFVIFLFKDVTYELGNFSTKIKSLIVHLASPSSPLKKKKKKKRKKIKSQSPTYVTIFIHFFSLPSCRPTRTQARLVNRGSGREEKGFECQDRFPQKPESGNNSRKRGVGVVGRGRRKCVGG